MATKQTERPQYFENQYLGAADLTAAVEYARLQQARHALGGHTWGIATGLHLVEKASASGGGQVDVFVNPGFAWDGFGRPVVVLSPYKLSPEKFKAYTFDAAVDGGSPEGRLVEVWLRYSETETGGPRAGFEVCYPPDQYSRVDEFFQVEVGERASFSDQRDAVSVAGHRADAREALQALDPAAPLLYDESVPYQTFPDPEGAARWIIPLGVVRWKPAQIPGQSGNFVARDDDDKKQSRSRRRYVGVVAESVGAAGGRIRLRDRAKDYSAVLSDDLVWVEGDLRVEGDARLFGGALDLRDAAGQDKGAPLHVSRKDGNTSGGVSLRARIGSAKDGKNRFDVGPVVGADADKDFKPRLSVLDSGRVGIGTTEPDRDLTVKGDAGTYINVKAQSGTYEVLLGADGNGGIVSTMTNHDLQLRAGGNSTKVVIKTDGNVGIGTTDASAARVVVNGVTSWDGGLALVGDSAVGVGMAFNNKNGHKFALFASGSSNQIGAGGFGIWDDNQHEYRIAIKDSGNVGVGTISPADRLDVQGNARVLSDSNPVRFTSAWSAFPDGATNRAEICNDTGAFKTLMIVGNKSAGLGRRVSVWDRLEVNGLHRTDVLQLGNKWRLSAIGDAHGNDEWLRLFDVNNVGYSGGFAAGKMWSTDYQFGSDLRMKKEVETLANPADGLLALRGVRFKWRDAAAGESPRLGLIAQEVEAVFPELVETGPNGMKGINFPGLLAPLVEAFKQQQREIAALREEVRELKKGAGHAHEEQR